MPDRGAFLVFALASLALAIVPGPAVLYIVAQSVQGGRRDVDHPSGRDAERLSDTRRPDDDDAF